jgi:GH25 family lysozyme M1 (1,4-beta-N-acetylmuramidase)
MSGLNGKRSQPTAAGRTGSNILGKSPVRLPSATGKRPPPSARQAATGSHPASMPAGRRPAPAKKAAPAAPAWMASFAKGLDVTTQFRNPKSPLFDWDAVTAAEEITIPGGRVAKDKISFIILKATLGHGPAAEAKNFKENWSRLSAMYRRVIRGAYHFLLFGANSNPKAQAEAYLNAVGTFFAALPPIVDVEDSRPEFLQWLGFELRDKVVDEKKGTHKKVNVLVNRKQFIANSAKCAEDLRIWIRTVKDATKREPMIYTFPKYWPTINSPKGFSDSPLWIADFEAVKHGPNPLLPVGGGWQTWNFWQFAGFPQTKTQGVSGIGNGIDLNFFNGTALELQQQVYKDIYVPTLGVGNF